MYIICGQKKLARSHPIPTTFANLEFPCIKFRDVLYSDLQNNLAKVNYIKNLPNVCWTRKLLDCFQKLSHKFCLPCNEFLFCLNTKDKRRNSSRFKFYFKKNSAKKYQYPRHTFLLSVNDATGGWAWVAEVQNSWENEQLLIASSTWCSDHVYCIRGFIHIFDKHIFLRIR